MFLNLGEWPRRLAPAAILLAAAAGGLAMTRHRRGGRPALLITRCPVHGIAYDPQLEVCPECVKVPGAAMKGDV